ncbi:heavy-metal-associated domain-containing protein [Apibacter raozihei]|uniref:heavy-metal-associated domain-containing protein n=1 Tax=Apibacter TaxID=1778601 RepID=UPI000FE38932|nr:MULTISPECIES: heavy-metal-associated domain-containing protein [Apibacter]
MKFINSIAFFILFFTAISLNAQIKNPKVEKIKIYGNCEMCKETIEKSGSAEGVSKVEWNKDNKIAVITYDDKKTSVDAILKNIAKSGYSSDKYKAKKSDYTKLPPCCQY